MKHLLHTFLIILSVLWVAPAAAQQPSAGLKLKTVVIDAGHGGKDAGCVSKDGKIYEKNLTLSISKLLGQKISAVYPDVKVIYTRQTDKYLTLNERAEIANKNHADLFISIHIDAFTNSTANGFSAHIFGRSNGKDSDLFQRNLDLCRRENSVIMLDENYEAEYGGFDPKDPESFIFFNLMQNAYYEQSILFAAYVEEEMSKGPIKHSRGVWQNPFYVLWRTSMPAVLVEMGFMSNSSDLSVMKTNVGKEQLATRLFDAFKRFKADYDGSVDISETVTAAPVPAPQEEPQQEVSVQEGRQYGVQVLVLSKKLKKGDKSLKGYDAEVYKQGNIYKYIVGISSTEAQAREKFQSIKKDFPDSFPVMIEDGRVSVIK